jgi:hypothetical protein
MKYTTLWYAVRLDAADTANLLFDHLWDTVEPGSALPDLFFIDDNVAVDGRFERENNLKCNCDYDDLEDGCGFFNCRRYTPEQRHIAKAWLKNRALTYFSHMLADDCQSIAMTGNLQLEDSRACCSKTTDKYLIGVVAYLPSFKRGVTKIESPNDLYSWTKKEKYDGTIVEHSDVRLEFDAFCAKYNLTPHYYVQHANCTCT